MSFEHNFVKLEVSTSITNTHNAHVCLVHSAICYYCLNLESIAREEAFKRTKWCCNQRPRSRHRQTISMAAMNTIDWIAFQSPGFVEKGNVWYWFFYRWCERIHFELFFDLFSFLFFYSSIFYFLQRKSLQKGVFL